MVAGTKMPLPALKMAKEAGGRAVKGAGRVFDAATSGAKKAGEKARPVVQKALEKRGEIRRGVAAKVKASVRSKRDR